MLRSTDFLIKNEFLRQMMNVEWKGGNTNTDKALELMYEEVRNTGRRAVGVVVTDGRSTDSYSLETALRKIHFMGFQMFAIGIGQEVKRKELEKIASDEKFHLFMIDDLDGLKAIESILTSRICPSQNDVQNETMCVEESGVLNFSSSLQRITENTTIGNTMLKSSVSTEISSLTFYHNNRAIIICNFSTDATEYVRSDMNVSQDYNLVFKLIEASHEGTYTRLLTFENGRSRKDVAKLFVKDPCLRIQKLNYSVDPGCRNVTCLTPPGGSLSLKGRILPSLKARVCIEMNNDGMYQCCSRTGNCESKAVTHSYTTNSACASRNVTLDVYFQDGLKGKIIRGPVMIKPLKNRRYRFEYFYPVNSGKGLLSFLTKQFIEIVGLYRPRLKNVQKRDEGLFIIGVGTQKEGPMQIATVKLVVNDPCFHTAELNNATHCYETKCLTSKNGTLMFEGIEQNSFEVRACNSSEYGMYNCCSPTNECISQYIPLDAEVLEFTPQIATTTSVTENPVIWIIGSAMAAILIAVVIVMALVKYRRSDRGRKVYFGVDGQNVVVDPYNTPSIPNSLNDDEEYASLNENEILPDDKIQTIRTMQAAHNPYEDLMRGPEENEYQTITRKNQDADERRPDKDSSGVKMTNEEKWEETKFEDHQNRHSQPMGGENTADVDEQNRHSQTIGGENTADVHHQDADRHTTVGGNMSHDEESKTD